jgi:1-phosphofructokinase family hexose kinase
MILCVCPNPSVDTLVNVPQFSLGQVNRVTTEQHYPGGKGIHVAMAARELGADKVHVLGFWAGPTGIWLRERLAHRNIAASGPAVDGWTRLCLTFRAPEPYNETELLGVGPVIEHKDEDELKTVFNRLISSASIVTMSGSWPVGAGESGYGDLIRSCAGRGIPTVLDCTGIQLEHALPERPYAVHLNASEAEAVFHTQDPAKAAGCLAKQCELSIVTDGPRGAYFVANGQLIHANCRIESQQYSSVGSGDCLVAGIALAISRELPLMETAALACACGAANCLRPELGMLYRADVDRLLPTVKIRSLP